jgi:hypothetical protein
MKNKNFFLVKSILINDKPKEKKPTVKLQYKTVSKTKNIKLKSGKIRKIAVKRKELTGRKKIEFNYGSSFTILEKVFYDEVKAENFIKSQLKKFKKSKSKSKKLVGSVQIGLGKAKISKDGFKFSGEVSRSGRLNSIYTNTNILTAKNNIIRMFDEAEENFNEYTIELVKVKSKKKLKNGKFYHWRKIVKKNDGKVTTPKVKISQFAKKYKLKKGR